MKTPENLEPEAQKREILERLAVLDIEKQTLHKKLGSLSSSSIPADTSESSTPKTPEKKAELFHRLFAVRTSVYPKLWVNTKSNQKGYSPACSNEWVRGICEKPRIKCSECTKQKFPPLDLHAVMSHLRGEQTIGTYAIREDDTCIFLAADFDGPGWSTDAIAYKEAALSLGIEVHLERSRSGNGAHGWIFFGEPISASKARRLGTLIVSKTIALHPGLKLSTYDRFFPNQDTLPKGGFGNLIALPLQKIPRGNKNTVFIDSALEPFPDQWEYLAKAKRHRLAEIESVLKSFIPEKVGSKEDDNVEFALSCDEKALDLIPAAVTKGAFKETARFELGNHVQINTLEMPAALVAALKRLATFPNPEFYHKQNLRFPTYQIPRFIFCGETHPEKLHLPRGVLNEAIRIIKKAGGKVALSDKRPSFPSTTFAFHGTLTVSQIEAVSAMQETEWGVLSATPGSGKTVMGCNLIAERQVRTLILAHRRPLIEQWRERIMEFLKLGKKEIGVLSSGKPMESYPVVLGMIQSLVKNPDAEAILSQYGQLIIDECHHVPAASFESVLKLCRARYILGLTATPKRKDGLERILFMQCGPIRHEIKGEEHSMEKRVILSPTPFRMIHPSDRPPIHLLWEAMIQDSNRNRMIVSDIIAAVRERRFCLVLSDRKDHLSTLQRLITESGSDIPLFHFESVQGKKSRLALMLQLEEHCQKQSPFILLSTSTLIGEGFDLPRLDTLFLTMPLSFKGRLIQYAGRLHRSAPGKTNVIIYDYHEPGNGLSAHMLKSRLKAYRQLGYQFDSPESPNQSMLFNRDTWQK